jgi:hypothetical protein
MFWIFLKVSPSNRISPKSMISDEQSISSPSVESVIVVSMALDMLGMCYILCMCVCVGASDMRTLSDDPSY